MKRRDFVKTVALSGMAVAASDVIADLIAQSPTGRVLESKFKGLSDVALMEAKPRRLHLCRHPVHAQHEQRRERDRRQPRRGRSRRVRRRAAAAAEAAARRRPRRVGGFGGGNAGDGARPATTPPGSACA